MPVSTLARTLDIGGSALPTPDELEARLWTSLRSDMTVMLGLVSGEHGHTRPMTALIEDGDHGPLWLFTAQDNALVEKLVGGSQDAAAQFVPKGHDLWASIEGTLTEHTDPAIVDRLWGSRVAAWYEDGKDDPKLDLLRSDPQKAEIWLDASSIVAGAMVVLGISESKESYKDNVATSCRPFLPGTGPRSGICWPDSRCEGPIFCTAVRLPHSLIWPQCQEGSHQGNLILQEGTQASEFHKPAVPLGQLNRPS